MDRVLQQAMAAIRRYIAGSSTEEDPAHADNTLEWLLRLRADADPALQLAALGHDIDRASPDKVRRQDFADYDAFKAAHAHHGAQLLERLLEEQGVERAIIERSCQLVRLHEVGGNEDADLLRDADSLSYFDTNLPLYLRREGEAEALRRSLWGLRRLSPRGLALLRQHPVTDPAAAAVLTRALALFDRLDSG
ncbi:DUF4202 family protein [Microbulbifer thermotolerans]|uniref:DUF4202 family protein n=1 Tax=Microbulbifer thermotolerans TaxID=252514 RepID=UPI0008F3F004|nr:DUF4202 family protein [Microbulbifer thermotolerans]MCX2795207.1 DUF4202 domain-containing protein [Microbulbifer thermotolerans]MCX2834377.1 DUF4202 domain-containing protein [Microbulbifer thermotolerans]SFC93458.1 protein of unknown function [Microbulbifer thermotolerans]